MGVEKEDKLVQDSFEFKTSLEWVHVALASMDLTPSAMELWMSLSTSLAVTASVSFVYPGYQ